MNNQSLRFRIPLVLLLGCLLFSVVLGGLVGVFSSAWIDVGVSRVATYSGMRNARLIEVHLRKGDHVGAREELSSLIPQPLLASATLFDGEDRVWMSTDPRQEGRTLRQLGLPFLRLAVDKVRAARNGVVEVDKGAGRIYAVYPVEALRDLAPPATEASALFVLTYDLAAPHALARSHAWVAGALAFGVLATLALALWFFLGRALVRRLENVMNDAEAAILGNDLPGEPQWGWDELGVISRRLHTLASVLRERTSSLQDSRRHLRALVDGSASLICILDVEGRILDVNQTALAFAGVEREALIGRFLWDVLWWARDPAAHERARLAVAQVQQGAQVSGEMVQVNAAGQVCHLSFSLSPVKDAQGVVVGIVPEARDVSAIHHAEAQLRETGERFRTLVENALVGVYMTDEGGVVYANPRLHDIFGYEGEALAGLRGLGDLVVPEMRDEVLEKIRACLGGDCASVYINFKGVRHDGRVIEAEMHGARTEYHGRPALIGVLMDVTERVRVGAQLSLLAKVFDHSRDAIVIADADRNVLEVNRAFCDMSGYAREEVVGQNPRMFSSGRHGPDFYHAMWKELGELGYWQGEIYNRRKSGEVYPLWMTLIGVRDANQALSHYIAIQSDASAYKEAEARIHRLAYYDMLTGLPNRVLLRERAGALLAMAERRQRELSFIFLDIDRFKTINDSLGHLAGDRLLEQVASRLEQMLREEDTIARLGGDEFVLVLPDTGADGATSVARKIFEQMSSVFEVFGHAISATPSLGVSVFPHDGTDFDALLQHADTALYEAKAAGRGTYRFYTHALNERAVERLVMDGALRDALERREFFLHYQPQIDLATGRIIGVEALLRWHHPEFGMMSPAKYIPLAEDNGLILPIGRWVLEEACRQSMSWRRAGLPPISMSVNISARQFRADALLDEVVDALAASGMSPECLELELTESMLIEDVDRTVETISALKRAGVKLALDDFGTGYSSLAYLRRFAIDRLKIDQSFVRDLLSDPDDRVIALSVIQLGHGLGLTVIAEGVETDAQAGVLRENGCDQAQGYLFARPMLPEAVAERLQVDLMVLG